MRSVNKPCVKAVQKIDMMKCYLAVAHYLATMQSACELFSDNVTLWWIIANTFKHDETSATTAYARLEHLPVYPTGRRSSSERQRGMSDKRSAESGVASGVSSINANGNVIFEKDLPEGMTLEDDANTVSLSRVQTIRENVFAIDEGWGLFSNDSASGGVTGATTVEEHTHGMNAISWLARWMIVARQRMCMTTMVRV